MAAHSCWPCSASVLPPPRRARRIEPLPFPTPWRPLRSIPSTAPVSRRLPSLSPSPTPPASPGFPHGRRRRCGGRRQRRDRGLRRPLQLSRRRWAQALRPPNRRRRERSAVLPPTPRAPRVALSSASCCCGRAISLRRIGYRCGYSLAVLD